MADKLGLDPYQTRALDKREYLVTKGGIIFVHSALKHILCDPSSQPSQRDSSDEGSQYMYIHVHLVSMRNKKSILNCHQIHLLV